jgi:hypothetical protein
MYEAERAAKPVLPPHAPVFLCCTTSANWCVAADDAFQFVGVQITECQIHCCVPQIPQRNKQKHFVDWRRSQRRRRRQTDEFFALNCDIVEPSRAGTGI